MSCHVHQKQNIYFPKSYIAVSSKLSKTQSVQRLKVLKVLESSNTWKKPKSNSWRNDVHGCAHIYVYINICIYILYIYIYIYII